MKTHTLILALACSACTSTADDPPDPPGTGSSAASFPAACPEQDCQLGATVRSADELALLIDFTPTIFDGPQTTGCRPASSDIAIHGTITLRSSDVAVPSSCSGAGCRQQVMFEVDASLAGATCLEPEPWFDFTVCGAVMLADTTVRVRSLIRDVHPGDPSFLPIVELVPGCAAPCGAGQFACAATQTCWDTERDYCAYCLGGDNETCACRDGGAQLDDGSSCSFFLSGDIEQLGTCEAGRCDPS